MIKVFDLLTTLFIFFSAVSYVSGQSFGAAQLQVFKVGAILLTLVAFSLKPRREVANPWWSMLIGWCLISFFTLPDKIRAVSIEQLVYLLLATALVYVMSNYGSLRAVLNGITAVVFVNLAMVILQISGLDPICINDSKTGINTHPVGLFGFRYVTGAWMAIATPVLLFSRRWVTGVISGILTICSMSIAPIGLMVLSLLGGLIMLRGVKWVIPALLILALVVGGIAFMLHTNNQQTLYHKAWLRVHLESKFLPIACQKPLFGHGLGMFKHIGPTVWNHQKGTYGTMVDPWNDYLGMAVETGFPTLFFFGGMVWAAVRRFKRNALALACSLAIIPIGCLFHCYFMHPSLNVLMISLFGLYMGETQCP